MRAWNLCLRRGVLGQIQIAALYGLILSSGRRGMRFVSAFASKTATFTTHKSFAELIDRYDAFILDQFGVIHNGVNALDGAVNCVENIYKAGKSLIILSNTSAPAKTALAKLPKYGFDVKMFVGGAVTSGEEASHYIRKTYGSKVHSSSKTIMFTWDQRDDQNPRLTVLPEEFIAQCGKVEIARTVKEADFLLFHGCEVWYQGDGQVVSLNPYIEEGSFESVDPLLEECLSANLPAVCANPDNIVRSPTGGIAHMPGKIAKRYMEMGGLCKLFGKPEVEHFEACVDRLGIDKSRICHVGDSLHHDIAGANEYGIASVFITSGIHANDFKSDFGEMPSVEKLNHLFECEKVTPTHVVSAFRL